jgi:predicted RNA methylase
MFFHTVAYHHSLLKDTERLAVFYDAINDYFKDQNDGNTKIVFDLGCGTGILSYFASEAQKIIAIDKNSEIIKKATLNLEDYKNIEIVNEDIISYEFPNNGDLIICEMLDTALIDEEQVPVINHVLNYVNDNATFIPKGIVNIAEPLNMNNSNIQYEDEDNKPKYEILGNSVKYSQFDFSKKIDKNYKKRIDFKITTAGVLNGLKITTLTLFNDKLIAGPTPMLNPPILIPILAKEVKQGENIAIILEYIMGGGLETIKAHYSKN